MSIKMNLEGFDELLNKIQKAGGKADNAAKKALEKSAKIFEEELKTEMQKSNVDPDLINDMPPPHIESEGGKITARVGYKKGAYDPRNPSTGYLVVFMNYGTPARRKHGKIRDISDGGKIRLGFIQRAKNKSAKKIKAQQEETLKDILKGL